MIKNKKWDLSDCRVSDRVPIVRKTRDPQYPPKETKRKSFFEKNPFIILSKVFELLESRKERKKLLKSSR